MSSNSEKTRDTDFKKGLTLNESRRKREDGLIDLRRARREEEINKRRQMTVTANTNSSRNDLPDISNSNIPQLAHAINSSDPSLQYNCVISLRKLISNHDNPPIKEVISSGVVPKLIEFLKFGSNQKLQYESAWILTNVASGKTEDVKTLINHGAIPPLVEMMRSPNIELAEQACWTLGNVAGDCAETRDIVLSAGGMDSLTSLITRANKETVIRTSAWALSNFCRGKPSPLFSEMSKCISYCTQLLRLDDREVVEDAAWGLAFISDDDSEHSEKIQAVTNSGCIPRMVSLLGEGIAEKKLARPLLRTLGNIATGNAEQTQALINAGGLEVLDTILTSSARKLHKEVVWTFSNVAAGTLPQTKALVGKGILKRVIDVFESQSFDVKKEINWVVSNVCSKKDLELTKLVVELGGLNLQVQMLAVVDVESVLVALEGINAILETGRRLSEQNNGPNMYADVLEEIGGIDKLEQMQDHNNTEVYNKTLSILTTYFAEDEDQLPGLPAQTQGGTFKFGGDNKGGFSEDFGKGFNF